MRKILIDFCMRAHVEYGRRRKGVWREEGRSIREEGSSIEAEGEE